MSMNNLRGLWRGKRENNNEWAFGDLLQIPYPDKFRPAIMKRDCAAECCYVDPSTLGECTGLRDKNGTPIFEGDIVEVVHPYNGKSIHKVVWYDFCWNLEDFRAACFDCPGLAFSEGTEYMTVVGNVYDNPELLKGVESNGSRG